MVMVDKVEVGQKVEWLSAGGGGCILQVTSPPDEHWRTNPLYEGCFSAVVLGTFNFPSIYIGNEYHDWKLSNVTKVIK